MSLKEMIEMLVPRSVTLRSPERSEVRVWRKIHQMFVCTGKVGCGFFLIFIYLFFFK